MGVEGRKSWTSDARHSPAQVIGTSAPSMKAELTFGFNACTLCRRARRHFIFLK